MKKINLSDETKGQLAYGLCFCIVELLIIGSFILVGIFGK